MEKFEIKVPINKVERQEELEENETPVALSVESITVPALKKEFHYSESISKETGIEGYERIKISWDALYDYLRDSIPELRNIAEVDDKKGMIMKLADIREFDIWFKDGDKSFTDYQGRYHESYIDSFKERVDKVIGEIDEYSEITNTNAVASRIVEEIKELRDELHKESDKLLELREEEDYLHLIGEDIYETLKTLPERNTLKRIDVCVKSLSAIIKPITEKSREVLISLLSTWSNGEFPKLTFNHILSGHVDSPERRERYRERLFKDDVFLQQIGIDSDPMYGVRLDLADGYLWDIGQSFISEPSFGFSPDDTIFTNIVKSGNTWRDTTEFITDPNVKQWLSQVDTPGYQNGSGYRNWGKSLGKNVGIGSGSGGEHPTLRIKKKTEYAFRWGHATYAIIPTEKNFNLIKLEHKSED